MKSSQRTPKAQQGLLSKMQTFDPDATSEAGSLDTAQEANPNTPKKGGLHDEASAPQTAGESVLTVSLPISAAAGGCKNTTSGASPASGFRKNLQVVNEQGEPLTASQIKIQQLPSFLSEYTVPDSSMKDEVGDTTNDDEKKAGGPMFVADDKEDDGGGEGEGKTRKLLRQGTAHPVKADKTTSGEAGKKDANRKSGGKTNQSLGASGLGSSDGILKRDSEGTIEIRNSAVGFFDVDATVTHEDGCCVQCWNNVKMRRRRYLRRYRDHDLRVCAFCGGLFPGLNVLADHQKYCELNPNKMEMEEKKTKLRWASHDSFDYGKPHEESIAKSNKLSAMGGAMSSKVMSFAGMASSGLGKGASFTMSTLDYALDVTSYVGGGLAKAVGINTEDDRDDVHPSSPGQQGHGLPAMEKQASVTKQSSYKIPMPSIIGHGRGDQPPVVKHTSVQQAAVEKVSSAQFRRSSVSMSPKVGGKIQKPKRTIAMDESESEEESDQKERHQAASQTRI